MAKIARAHGVDRKRVSRRLKGIGGRTSKKPVNYKLSEIQETALIQYIQTLDHIGTGVRLEQVISTANSILRQDYILNGCGTPDKPSTINQGQFPIKS